MPPSDHIARRPDVRHTGAQVVVYDHGANRVEAHARLLQAHVRRVGAAARGHQQPRCRDLTLLSVHQGGHDYPNTVAAHADDLCPCMHGEPFLAQDVGQGEADLRLVGP